jgi:transcriptional regulator GlxA family with amidase domain
MAGLLEGRHANTHHLGVDVLEATGVNVVQARVVGDGDLVTAGGVPSGPDLALHLLDRSYGPRVALAVEALFAYERRSTVWANTARAILDRLVQDAVPEIEAISRATWHRNLRRRGYWQM